MVAFLEIAARLVGRVYSLYFDYMWFCLFPALVLRAGFGFWLLQFLIFEYISTFSVSMMML